ncbi:MAG: hypothetical protein JU82_07295 [Sulfuricurvum sp. MLSB]|uniref:hypothetical protein n=1 Tax=Sulfuricurvum sp. MLSB TaxID=1537917 RepID=UPI000505A2BE|nr:hypothetical protein [Sulfuricurvum sp. MLSB]KFN39389.1 MAG: hypothetical protein JU82_07295 [Sulfuricurvum sp. MLSB]
MFCNRFADIGRQIRKIGIDIMDDVACDLIGFLINLLIHHHFDPADGVIIFRIFGQVDADGRTGSNAIDHRRYRDIRQFKHPVCVEPDNGQFFAGIFKNDVYFGRMGKFAANDIIVKDKNLVIDGKCDDGAILVQYDVLIHRGKTSET